MPEKFIIDGKIYSIKQSVYDLLMQKFGEAQNKAYCKKILAISNDCLCIYCFALKYSWLFNIKDINSTDNIDNILTVVGHADNIKNSDGTENTNTVNLSALHKYSYMFI